MLTGARREGTSKACERTKAPSDQLYLSGVVEKQDALCMTGSQVYETGKQSTDVPYIHVHMGVYI